MRVQSSETSLASTLRDVRLEFKVAGSLVICVTPGVANGVQAAQPSRHHDALGLYCR